MATNSTLLCIHQDPAQLSLLQEHGYELLTATTGREGLQLFMSQPVDAIVLDYQLGLLDGGVVAAAIKKVQPQVPIIMLAEHMDIPVAAINSVDALVVKSDLAHSLWRPSTPFSMSSPPDGYQARLKRRHRSASPPPQAMGWRGTSASHPCSIGHLT